MDGLPRLREVRESKLVTQAELAAKAGVSEATIVRVEHGQSMPRFSTIRKLARALNVDPAALIGDPIRGGAEIHTQPSRGAV